MKVYETMSLSRSGHHSMKNWVIRNLVGFQVEWVYKMINATGTKFYHLGEANHDIPLSFKFLKEFKNDIHTIMVNYEDAPWDYTLFNEDRIFKGPLSLEMNGEYDIEHMGRICFIRNFYDLLSSRIKSNNETIFTKWDTNEPHLFKVDGEFIKRWKSHAMACVENKVSYLKFEDWIDNKEVRERFIFETFGVKDRYGLNGIRGSRSSFSTHNNLQHRHKELNLSDEMKDLIKSDKDLTHLISELNYDVLNF
jgi:cell fate (sporulation/competence/biofilm development) regulator YlbF (YheA/YmcA/DUF963 family)